MYRKLPQELIDNVEYWLYETALCPGYLYPHRQQKKHAKCCLWPKEANVVARPALLTLSKSIKAKYETRMWSENVWVVGTGEAEKSMAFLQQLTPEATEYIQKLQLSFTICDLDGTMVERRDGGHEKVLCAKEFQSESVWGSYEGCDQWWGKWERVWELPLQSLLLDFTECHDLDRYWQGNWIAEYMGLWHKKPWMPDFRVLVLEEH